LIANQKFVQSVPDGWRFVAGVPELQGKVALAPVASLLEHAYADGISPGLLGAAFDKAQAPLMKLIMWNAAIHGANVLRGAASLDGGLAAYGQYWRMVKAADPVLLEAARSGAAVFGRSDIGPRLSQAMDAALTAAKGDEAPTTNRLAQLGANAAHLNDHILWNQAVPALGLMAWGQSMKRWAEITDGKFLVGSPEYEQAAQQAATFANHQMGQVQPLLRCIKRALPSPDWGTIPHQYVRYKVNVVATYPPSDTF